MGPSENFDLAAIGELAWPDNWTHGAGTTHGELMQPETGAVWLAQQPVTRERYEALAIPDGFLQSGIGESVADVAYFRRSPDAAFDGPLETIEIDGLRFSRVARPGVPEPGLRGVIVLPVYKYHRIAYAAGRTIDIMDCGDGWDYVPLMAHATMPGGRPPNPDAGAKPRVLPEGWSMRSLTLRSDLVVELPCPTRVTIFPRIGDSFQGPVRLRR